MDRKNCIVSGYRFSKGGNRLLIAGKYFVILAIARGSCYVETGGEERLCGTEEMILIKPGEKIRVCAGGGRHSPELLEIRVRPEYLRELSDKETDLEQGFSFVPFKVAVIRAESAESMQIKNLALKLGEIVTGGEEEEYGRSLFERSLVSMLLILALRACINADKVHLTRRRKHVLMDDIFVFIREHLTEELSLERLEQEFFVSRYHICREFRRLTGQTPHAYIVKSRLDLCRKYIEQGKSIHEFYQLGGFGGYNHFFRAFRKEYGVTPKEYYRNLQPGNRKLMKN